MSTPDPYSARLQQAQELFEQGRHEDALAALYSLVAIAPNHRDGWWLIARNAPHTPQRLDALKRVLQIDPEFAPARQMAARYGAFDVPTAQRVEPAPPPPSYSPAQYGTPPEYGGPPQPASAQPEYPPAQTAPGGPPPAPNYVSHPAQAYPPPPPQYVPPPEPAPEKRKREVIYEERKQLQPFLVVNGGCTSGCFALVLTVIVLGVVAFLLIGDQVGAALREVNALGATERVPADLIPAVALTAVLAFLQTHPISLPFNLGAMIAGAGATLPDSHEVFAGALQTLWTSLGYPASTGSVLMTHLKGVGPRLSAANWIPPVVFLVGWVVLAFIFVFLRARSMRLLNWFLSTAGLWLAAALAAGLGMLLFRVAFGA